MQLAAGCKEAKLFWMDSKQAGIRADRAAFAVSVSVLWEEQRQTCLHDIGMMVWVMRHEPPGTIDGQA